MKVHSRLGKEKKIHTSILQQFQKTVKNYIIL